MTIERPPMEKQMPNVLLVDDETNILKTMKICLEDLGLDVTAVSHPEAAVALLQKAFFDLAFIDLKMTPIDGMAILEALRSTSPETTAVIITAHGSIESAVEAIKKGAHDYLQKPFDYLELQLFAQKTLAYHRLKQEVRDLRNQVESQQGAGDIITRNPQMQRLLHLAKRVAETDLSVLIEGESGTGKERFADFIFRHSNRSETAFVKVNCAAIPDNLLESELFGHVKGAFTGAIKDRVGRFAAADGGTIFLDEIGDLSPEMQAKLLRVLQSGEIQRIGENTTRQVNVRVIAATNQNLENAIENGHFREDLFYRINAVRLKLLPLRKRPEDILLLMEYFQKQFHPGGEIEFSPAVRRAMLDYHWPGNVRELENVVRRAALLARDGQVTLADLPDSMNAAPTPTIPLLSLAAMERQHIRAVLEMTNDLKEAANILGIDPATLWRKRKRYQL